MLFALPIVVLFFSSACMAKYSTRDAIDSIESFPLPSLPPSLQAYVVGSTRTVNAEQILFGNNSGSRYNKYSAKAFNSLVNSSHIVNMTTSVVSGVFQRKLLVASNVTSTLALSEQLSTESDHYASQIMDFLAGNHDDTTTVNVTSFTDKMATIFRLNFNDYPSVCAAMHNRMKKCRMIGKDIKRFRSLTYEFEKQVDYFQSICTSGMSSLSGWRVEQSVLGQEFNEAVASNSNDLENQLRDCVSMYRCMLLPHQSFKHRDHWNSTTPFLSTSNNVAPLENSFGGSSEPFKLLLNTFLVQSLLWHQFGNANWWRDSTWLLLFPFGLPFLPRPPAFLEVFLGFITANVLLGAICMGAVALIVPLSVLSLNIGYGVNMTLPDPNALGNCL